VKKVVRVMLNKLLIRFAKENETHPFTGMLRVFAGGLF
jgi:hypothetical protein